MENQNIRLPVHFELPVSLTSNWSPTDFTSVAIGICSTKCNFASFGRIGVPKKEILIKNFLSERY